MDGRHISPQPISHYEILDKLGEGGMGVVWKARDTRLNRLVAIKTLPAGKLADEDRQRRFIQEAQAASALNDPNIVTIYDIASENGADFIAMEYVDGKTLGQLIPKRGMRMEEILRYAIQIAGALAKAHAAGIVHRDLKPGNIMVNAEGRVKLLDFGLAKLTEPDPPAGPDEDAATRTLLARSEEGSIAGTAAYMSPEQAEGKPVDARSDIFSFGAVLYEMATGTRAFQGDSKLSTLSAVLRENPKPPSQAVSGVPRELDRIVARCLRKDPARRFQAMPDLKVALEELKEESDSGIADLSGWRRARARPQTAPQADAGSWRRQHCWWRPLGPGSSIVPRRSRCPPCNPFRSPPTPAIRATPVSRPTAARWPSNGPARRGPLRHLRQAGGGWHALEADHQPPALIQPCLVARRPPDRIPPRGRLVLRLSAGGPGTQAGRRARGLIGVDARQPVAAGQLRRRAAGQPTAIFQLSLRTGEMRPVTSPPPPANPGDGDHAPAVSPDGRTLAFLRSVSRRCRRLRDSPGRRTGPPPHQAQPAAARRGLGQ